MPSKKSFRSISVRLAFRFTLVLTAAVIILSIAFVLLVQSFVSAEREAELVKSAESIEKSLVQSSGSGEGRPRVRKKSSPEDSPNLSVPYYISFVVSDSEGEVLLTNDPLLPTLSDTEGKVRRLFRKNFFIDGNLNIIYFAKTVESPERTYVVATVVDMDRQTDADIFSTLPKSILMAVWPILLISFFISYLITSRTMKPVVRVTRAASKISSSNLGIERLSLPKHDDEIAELIRTFNSLFDRLKIDFDREKQFTSDVSHELKTPVAVILGQTNLLLRWGKDDPEQLLKSLSSIKRETKSMEAIISNLLQISRLERGKIEARMERVGILPLFMRIREELSSIAPDAVSEIDVSPGDLEIDTDLELLHQVLTVIVSNSVKYAGNSCRISLSARKSDKFVKILLSDDGPGFEEKSIAHVFDRFFRGNEAHTRDSTTSGGSGLGLSIAKVIVGALGGRISAFNAVPHGAGIMIEMRTAMD